VSRKNLEQNKDLLSPLTYGKSLRLIKSFQSFQLILNYKKVFNIDIENYLNGVDQIDLYECLDSGYKFYSPEGIAGDGELYKNLEKFDWYYDPWKWEHEVASNFCLPGQKILEVGCGKGSFIKYLEDKKSCYSIGLEINGQNDSNPTILNESIQNHSKINQEKYDVVACFQVLEHISQIREFLDFCISCLKPGGKLIVSVPNNGGFIGKDLGKDLLNMPPHHMGLWDINSLKYLSKISPLKFYGAQFEPLRKTHVSWFVDVLENQLFSNKDFLKKIFRKSKIKGFLKFFFIKFPKLVKGHTVIAVFIKN
jgi:SAM-dependent methyltransferase